MADYKELLGNLLGRAKDVMDSTGVTQVYQKGAERTRIYGRMARLTRESSSQAEELRKVFLEIGKLYFEQERANPKGVFAPLFAQAAQLQDALRAKEAELDALKESLKEQTGEQDIEVEITQEEPDFDAVVDATANEGKGTET